jgi:copper(I)-binding protein
MSMSASSLVGALGAAVLALALPSPALAQAASPPGHEGHAGTGAATSTFRAGPILIEQPWARATPGGAKVGGGYMRITNTGTAPDRLLGGTVAAAGRFEVHRMSMSDDVMRMAPVEALELKPGATVQLKPGGYHAMFVDLKQPLREGDRVKGTLAFEKAGRVDIEYVVRGIGAQGAEDGAHAH